MDANDEAARLLSGLLGAGWSEAEAVGLADALVNFDVTLPSGATLTGPLRGGQIIGMRSAVRISSLVSGLDETRLATCLYTFTREQLRTAHDTILERCAGAGISLLR